MKFLIIDDHYVVRSGISALLSLIYQPCEIYEAENDLRAKEQLKLFTYDLIIMDIQIPNVDMLAFMEFVHKQYPETKVLMLSMSPENIYARRFLKAGAKGFLPKDSSLDEIKKALNLVLNNRKYISAALAESLAEDSISDAPANPFDKLSQREFEITSLLLSGKTITEIGKLLTLQLSTIGTHKARVFEKLGVANMLELKDLATGYNF